MRDSLGTHKHKMDKLGVFHPEVNAHRVSSQYLIKLYKGIQSANIEDAALLKMQADIKSKREIEEEAREALTSADSDGRLTGRNVKDTKNRSSIPSSRVMSSRKNTSRSFSRTKRPGSGVISRPESATAYVVKAGAAANTDLTQTAGTDDSSPPNLPSAIGAGGLFKSKFKAAGTTDPRKILEEEAARLSSCAQQEKRTNNSSMEKKNAVVTLEDRVADALFKPLKTNQLANAAGVQKNPTNIRTPLTQNSAVASKINSAKENGKLKEQQLEAQRAQVWKDIVELKTSLPKLSADRVINPVEYDYIFSKPGTVPQHIMTMDEFISTFKEHNSCMDAAVKDLKNLEELTSHEPASNSQNHKHKPGANYTTSLGTSCPQTPGNSQSTESVLFTCCAILFKLYTNTVNTGLK